MAKICKESSLIPSGSNGLTLQIEASRLFLARSGAFRRLPNLKLKAGKGLPLEEAEGKMLSFLGASAPSTHQKHLRPFHQN
jgi:hypothetical protein